MSKIGRFLNFLWPASFKGVTGINEAAAQDAVENALRNQMGSYPELEQAKNAKVEYRSPFLSPKRYSAIDELKGRGPILHQRRMVEETLFMRTSGLRLMTIGPLHRCITTPPRWEGSKSGFRSQSTTVENKSASIS